MPQTDFSDPSVHWLLPDEASLLAAAVAVRAATEALAEGPTRFERFQDGSYGERARENIDRTALMGRCNPVAPPKGVALDPERRSICRITFSEVHQGAPGVVHGGWVASVLDQLAGHVIRGA